MIAFIGINFLIYMITIIYIANKLVDDAAKMNYKAEYNVVFNRILYLQNVNEEIIPLIPLIPIINLIYVSRIIFIYTAHKEILKKQLIEEQVFIKIPSKINITNKEEISLEEMLSELLNEIDSRNYTIDDLIFFKKALEVFKIRYTSVDDKKSIENFSQKLNSIVEEKTKTKKLQK